MIPSALPSALRPLLVLLLGLSLAAQSAEEPQAPEAPVERLAAWQAAHGPTWIARVDEETGAVRALFGGAAEPPFAPRSDADWVALARGFAEEAEPLLGIAAGSLVPDRVTFLPLGLVGSGDKVTVRFRQVVDGVPVRGGSVNALFLADGRLVSLDSLAHPGAADAPTFPTVGAGEAEAVARRAFALDAAGRAPTSVGEPRLVLAQVREEKTRSAVLAWEVDVLARSEDPAGWTYLVAARGPARVVAREELVHNDVGGTVQALATTGTKPDGPGNPPAAVPVPRVLVTSAAGNVVTDADGSFLIPGVPSASVTIQFLGPFADADHVSGPDHSVTTVLSGTGNTVTMNPAPTELVTSQANAFVEIVRLREWIRSLNPDDDTADFQADANVNISSTCNAYFDGSSVNFYRSGGGCVNTAYSTVVAHEMGHWLNVRYGSGNGSDGFGEGNADVFAMYLYDDPVVGEDFFGPGSMIRTGLNTRQFCGDHNPGCYGQVHADGEVLMGALWKVRHELNLALGDAMGDLTANLLFSGWMNAFDDGQIKSIIEEHWLVLDDDDGIVGNGTPHYDQIDAGFVAQGFPGFQLDFVTFQGVTEIASTQDENGPYGVAAELQPVFAPAVAIADVHWRVDGGPWNLAPMAKVTGDTWTAVIPGQPSPAKVEYWLEATDSLGSSNSYPSGAPQEALRFAVGVETVFFEDDFETDDDNGWTHAQIATQDDWHHMAPFGKGGSSQGVPWSDPASAFSGEKCWGNDLGPSGWNGAYQPNVVNFLRSPAVDLSAASGTTLEFQRWLTVERSIFDVASIRVNGVEAWRNPPDEHLLDTQWEPVSLDVSALADGNPAVQFEWRLQTDAGLNLGGWNLDDVRVLSLDPSPAACLPSNYGTGLGGAAGVPAIDSAGQAAVLGNDDFQVALKGGPPLASAWLGVGFAPASVPAFGGTVLVSPATVVEAPLDVFGHAHVALPIPPDPGLAGAAVHFQGVVDDPGAPHGLSMTPGLAAVLCQ